MDTLLALQGVHVSVGGTAILRDASLRLTAGAHTLLLGPSGSGKTTLLNVIARLIPPTEGEVHFKGQLIADYGPPAQFRREQVGYIFQDLHLLETLSIAQNIELVQAAIGASNDAPDPHALLEPLGLGDRLNDRVSVLSRGERQRVALARAFANRPSLVLADEPTSSLDPGSRERTLDHLWSLCDQTGATALVVSHDEALRTHERFSQQLMLDDGAVTPAAP